VEIGIVPVGLIISSSRVCPLSTCSPHSRGTAIAQSVQQHRERGRPLSLGRIIQVIAGKRRAPVGQNADESAFSDVLSRVIFEEISQT
jgi:hypothetical protein